ncbi:hypothetical protein OWR29_45360 [Actinoplanes sp. Pm04-4]|uniref:Knr4/Smi1-like domain-containing protein n=1 Tax=Paractinoplanes pyxinae TaxID=2997416 RepID=A0ABT4BFF7_9ACTN|nr:hypothetical protein [Actinoplanes pyxinae]MCY1145274.1 hypothetical protein [Actinoplanes pyxinae]
MDVGWVEWWRDELRVEVRRLVEGFEARVGFPPGEHRVGGPASAAELAGLRQLHGDALPADLLLFYGVVAEVDLPDVDAGYWIHRPAPAGEDPGHPRRLSDGRRIVVFGSDGGGALFALPAGSGGPVLRLSGGAVVGDVYDADGATAVAGDLAVFLSFLRRETAA